VGDRERGEKESEAQACQKGREHPNVKQQHGYITDLCRCAGAVVQCIENALAERQFGAFWGRGPLVRPPCIPPPSPTLRAQQPDSSVGSGMRGCDLAMECRAGLEKKRHSNPPSSRSVPQVNPEGT